MKEKKKKKTSHENFMTEKEKTYVEAMNKKTIIKTPLYKITEQCFNPKDTNAFIRYKREKPTEIQETEKGLSSLNLKKSRKKPRIIQSEHETTLSERINCALSIENIIDYILKIKYDYNEIILQEEEEYNPINVSVNMKEENCEIALKKIQSNIKFIFKHKKIINHLIIYYSLISEELKRNFILFLIEEPFLEEEGNICLFLESIYKEIPIFYENEILNYKNSFFLSIPFLMLSTIFILKNKNLHLFFMDELSTERINDIFKLKNTKYIWQFFSVLISNADKIKKNELYFLLRDKMNEAIEKEDNNVIIFLESIGLNHK